MSSIAKQVLAVIPARLKHSKYPNKLLATLRGKPLIAHTVENVSKAASVRQLLVATDDDQIADAVQSSAEDIRKHRPVDITVFRVKDRPVNSTERTLEVLQTAFPSREALQAIAPSGLVVHVHGDEPLVHHEHIDLLVARMLKEKMIPMAVLSSKVHKAQDLSTDSVKVVTSLLRRALYFSRALIPHHRDGTGIDLDALMGDIYYKSVGLFCTRIDFLLDKYAKMTPTPLERQEQIEQLRILEFGFPIAVETVESSFPAVDKPEDLFRVEMMLKQLDEGVTERPASGTQSVLQSRKSQT